jgi:hypothetical protein
MVDELGRVLKTRAQRLRRSGRLLPPKYRSQPHLLLGTPWTGGFASAAREFGCKGYLPWDQLLGRCPAAMGSITALSTAHILQKLSVSVTQALVDGRLPTNAP